MSPFSPDVERAIEVCLTAHDGQTRKGSQKPYASHPVHIALMLGRLGVDDVVVQAALLHDVVEDCPEWTSERLAELFGEEVGRLVAWLTEDKDGTWEERKAAGVAKAATMDPRAATVKAADKLHNLSSLVRDLRAAADPADVWRHFKGGPRKTYDLAERLVDALAPRVDPRLAGALRSILAELREFVVKA